VPTNTAGFRVLAAAAVLAGGNGNSLVERWNVGRRPARSRRHHRR
jgi:hypothetical protein